MKTAKRTWKYKYRGNWPANLIRNDAKEIEIVVEYIDAYKLIATDLEGYEYNPEN
jgi:hypothetical protein